MTTSPVLVRDGVPHPLRRLSLTPRGSMHPDSYDEKWLQDLIQRRPELLPTTEIEPGFGRLIPVATEVPCGHGLIDNLFLTPEGGIAIVETKLWRNLESRRQVVAQALDYAAALTGMGYATFERTTLSGSMRVPKPASLYGMLAGDADILDEPRFIDALSRNLKRGRMLVIVAADGVRAETEALADLLQSHAGAHFTFALVAIELFKGPDGVILAVPRSLVKTELVDRGVVTILDDRVAITPSPPVQSTGYAPRLSLTEAQFLEDMAKRDPGLPVAIRHFIERLRELQVEPQWLQSLKFTWASGPDQDVNLGYISRKGVLWTDFTLHGLRDVAPEPARRYLADLAELIDGQVITRDVNAPYVATRDGRKPKIESILPARADGWQAAIERLVHEARQVAAAD